MSYNEKISSVISKIFVLLLVELEGKSSKKRGIFTVRLTVRVDPPYGQGVVIFSNKLTYFDLFYHFIMEKI